MTTEGLVFEQVAKSFAALCVAATALLSNKTVAPQLLDMFDSASGDLLDLLRARGVDEQQLQRMEIAMARLRLTLDA